MINPLITYLRDLADGGAVLDAHKLRAAANAIERTYLADPAHGREQIEREAYKAGMMAGCDHPLKEEWIEAAYAEWRRSGPPTISTTDSE